MITDESVKIYKKINKDQSKYIYKKKSIHNQRYHIEHKTVKIMKFIQYPHKQSMQSN